MAHAVWRLRNYTLYVVHTYARQRLEVVIGWDTPKDVYPGRSAFVWDGV